MSSRLVRGFQLARYSLTILREQPSLAIFPLLSALGCMALIGLFVSPLWYLIGLQWQAHHLTSQSLLFLILILALLFLCNLVILFCNAALIALAIAHARQEPVKLSIGFKKALNCFPQIVLWTLFNTTIGAVLRIFQTRLSTFAAVSTSLAGIAWSVICYFVTPILVIEKARPLKTIKRSSELLQKNWGSSLISNTGLGILLFLIRLFALSPALLGLYLGSHLDKIIGSIISAVLLFVIVIVNSAIHNILRAVLYDYATEKNIPAAFNQSLLKSLFSQRSV